MTEKEKEEESEKDSDSQESTKPILSPGKLLAFGSINLTFTLPLQKHDIKKAIDDSIDVVLIDTAGRLQNKVNLMKELEKIKKVISREMRGAPHETLLVIDATTGQNGMSQAKAFKEITNITGLVLSKMDGTAKGGIVLAIKEEINIPVKYIGLGEGLDDLRPFDIENYIYGLFKDMM